MRWQTADERRHDDAPGAESWGLELGTSTTTGSIRLTLDVARGRAAFVADFVLPGAGRIVVADEDVPVPRPAAGLEIRTEGLWASLYCETPFEHWTLGLEAFGLRVDDLGDAREAGSWDALVGERVPVGFDLEWEHRGPPEPLTEGAGYAQAGVVVGEVLVERAVIPIETVARRDHWWGGAPGVRSDPTPPLPD